MKKKIILGYLIIAFLAIFLHYKNIYDEIITPPSNKWAKEIEISKARLKSYPKVLKMKENYLIAFDDAQNIDLVTIDKLGNRINEKSINAMDEMVRNLSLITDGKNIYVSWIISNSGVKSLIQVKLDEALNVLNTTQYFNICDTAQIGDSILAISTVDKIEILDVKNNKKYSIDESRATHLAGAEADGKVMLAYLIGENEFKYVIINNGVAKSEYIGTVGKGVFDSFGDSALSFDDKYGYLLVENKVKGQYGNIIAIVFDLDGNNYNISKLKVGYIRYLYNPQTVSSGERAVFVAGSERKVGKKDEQYDIVEFVMDGEEIKEYNYVSKTSKPSMMPYYYDNYIAFADYLGEGIYKINLTSSTEEFKEIYNKIRPIERFEAFYKTFITIINSLLYIFIYGISWIFVGLLLVSIFMFFQYSLKDSKKLLTFVLIYLMTIVAKIYTVYRISYITFSNLLPSYMSNIMIGIFINIIISLLALKHGYDDYKNNIYESPFMPFSKALIIDTFLTQLVFVPFII
ncbi:MAG: hypothetical protein N2486_03060 [Caloramator sp.]|nr:hypothetical protein [Caloramator sp.]